MSERDDLSEQGYQNPFADDQRALSQALDNAVFVGIKHRITQIDDSITVEEHPDEVSIYEAGRGLDYLLGLQQKVEEAWGRDVDPNDPAAISAYIRDVVLCATDELHEVLAEVNWKPWKDTQGIKDVSAYRGEMADVLHFVLDLYIAAGLTGRDIVLDYVAKHLENLRRVKSVEYRTS